VAPEFWVPEFGEPAVGAAEPCAPGVGPAVLGTADGAGETAGDDERPAVGAAEDGPDGPGLADVPGGADREAGASVTAGGSSTIPRCHIGPPMRQTRSRGPGGGDGCCLERAYAGRHGLLTLPAVRGIIPLINSKVS